MGLILPTNLRRNSISGDYQRVYEAYGEESVIENAIECENELAAITESFFQSDALELRFMRDEQGYSDEYTTESSLINSREELEAVQEGILSNGLEKLKAVWAKIKEATISFFTVLGAKVNAVFMNNKKFLSKYKSSLKGEVEIKGYQYDINAIDKVIAACGIDNVINHVGSICGEKSLAGLSTLSEQELSSVQEKAKGGLEKLVTAICSAGHLESSSTISEFKKAMTKVGQGEKESSLKVSASEIITVLTTDVKKEKQDIDKEINKAKKEFDSKIKELDGAAKKLKKGEGNAAAVIAATRAITELVNKGRVITISAFTTKKALTSKQSKQFKRAAAKLIAKNSKSNK